MTAAPNNAYDTSMPKQHAANMGRLQFLLPALQRARLEKQATDSGITVSEHVRRAIDEYLDRLDTKGVHPSNEKEVPRR